MLLQIVNGISKLRVSGAEPRAYAAWEKAFILKKRIAVQARTVSTAYLVLTSVAPVLSAAAIFAATAVSLDEAGTRTLSKGAFIAFNAAFVQFQMSALGLGSALVTMLGLVPLYERTAPILTTLPETESGKDDPGILTGEIEVERVSFRYRLAKLKYGG